jgi:hypothetical protein
MLQTQVVQPTSNTLANTDIKKPLPGIQAPPTHTDVKHQYPKDEKKKMKQPMRNSLPPQHIKLPSPTSYNYNNRASSPTSTITTTPPLTPQLFHNPSGNRSFSSFSFQSSTVSDPLLDHSHLKPGQNASLLSYNKTIDMYRENARKTNNMDVQCDFAIFLVEAAKRFPDDDEGYIQEAEKLLKQVAVRGHSESQYYLANMYAAGLLNKQSPDFEKAFPLFVQSAKHHHPDAAYR